MAVERLDKFQIYFDFSGFSLYCERITRFSGERISFRIGPMSSIIPYGGNHSRLITKTGPILHTVWLFCWTAKERKGLQIMTFSSC